MDGWVGRGEERERKTHSYIRSFIHPPTHPPTHTIQAVQMLMGLGFERGAVLRALQAAGNNVEVAANRLLQGA